MKAIVRNHLLTSATNTLIGLGGITEQNISLDVLESVAQIRYALTVVAELFQLRANEKGQVSANHTRILHGRIASILINEAR